MDNVKNHNLRITSLAIIACFLWSTAFVAVKIGLKYSDPFFFAGIRFIISGLIIIPFCGSVINYLKIIFIHKKIILVVSLLQTFFLYGLFFKGMTLVKGAQGAIIIGSSPLVTAIIAHFFMHNDKMTFRKIISILFGITGVVILSISRKPWTETGFKELIGVLLLLSGTVASAFGNIVVAKEKKNVNPLILNSSQILLGGIFLLAISIPIEGLPLFNLPIEFYIALVWLSVLSAVAFSIWFYLLKKANVKVSELNLWKFVIPVSGSLISWILLPDEYPDFFSIIGMVSVGLSIIFYTLISNK